MSRSALFIFTCVMLYQAADFCSIVSCAFVAAYFCGVDAFPKILIAEKDKKHEEKFQNPTQFLNYIINAVLPEIFARVRSKAVARFFTVIAIFTGIAAAFAYFLTPSHLMNQLGFLGSFKEYLDEAADLASIFLFAHVVRVQIQKNRIGRFFQEIKKAKFKTDGTPETEIDFSILSESPYSPLRITAFIVIFSLFLSFAVFKEVSAVNFFKNSLDEVADVCSILTVAIYMFDATRMANFPQILMSALFFAGLKEGIKEGISEAQRNIGGRRVFDFRSDEFDPELTTDPNN